MCATNILLDPVGSGSKARTESDGSVPPATRRSAHHQKTLLRAMPLNWVICRNETEIAELLKQHSATTPE
ncbi:MAG: hypothetical protein M2R45_05185 [Verrucomicrobia subdivision 3 bacterium]|nr:hypothetical protein [Limisphaerales bacterium]MCS1417590.1 hypothetical protein [Limisphaerales bacterium]